MFTHFLRKRLSNTGTETSEEAGVGDISDAATFLRRTYHFLMNSLPYQNLQIQPHTNTTGTNRRMEHQTAIITLVRGLASLIVAVQVLGVQFQRT